MAQGPLDGREILIVTDDLLNAMYLNHRVVRSGGTVLTAYSSAQAITLAKSATLCDVMIDHSLDGSQEVVRVLDQLDLPYIFFTGPDAPKLEMMKSTTFSFGREILDPVKARKVAKLEPDSLVDQCADVRWQDAPQPTERSVSV